MNVRYRKLVLDRAKNQRINTMGGRILKCFLYSMNAPALKAGSPPQLGDAIYRNLQSYFAWLAADAPSGKSLSGRGFRKLEKTSQGSIPRAAKRCMSNTAPPVTARTGKAKAIPTAPMPLHPYGERKRIIGVRA